MTLYTVTVGLSSVYCDTIVRLLNMIYEYITRGREADIDIVYVAIFVEFLGRCLGQSIARLQFYGLILGIEVEIRIISVSDSVSILRLRKIQSRTWSQH